MESLDEYLAIVTNALDKCEPLAAHDHAHVERDRATAGLERKRTPLDRRLERHVVGKRLRRAGRGAILGQPRRIDLRLGEHWRARLVPDVDRGRTR